jgi:hypothetical protein
MNRYPTYKGVCWYCVHKSVNDEYCAIPICQDEEGATLHVFGFFCSLACAAAYIENSMHRLRQERAKYLFECMSRVNFRCEVMRPAPHIHNLYTFGGTMTIEEFRAAGGIKRIEAPYMARKKHQRHFISQRQGKPFTLLRSRKAIQRMQGLQLLSSSASSSSS